MNTPSRQYRQVAARVYKARRCLIDALGIVRENGLRLAAPLEQRIAALDALQSKFEKLSKS